jgi:hypothetical protein
MIQLINDVVGEDDERRITRSLMSHRLAVFGNHFPKALGVNNIRNSGCIFADPVWSEM